AAQSASRPLQLVEQIGASRYVHGIYGEISMHNLRIITRLPQSAFPDGPYLTISPLFDGSMEFRYFDTFVRQMLWHRKVSKTEAFATLERFFDQLHWFPRISQNVGAGARRVTMRVST